jgi:hypothetical protein
VNLPDSCSMDWGYHTREKRDEAFEMFKADMLSHPPPLPCILQKFESPGAAYGNLVAIIWNVRGASPYEREAIKNTMDDYLVGVVTRVKTNADHSGWEELEWAADVIPVSKPFPLPVDPKGLLRLGKHVLQEYQHWRF